MLVIQLEAAPSDFGSLGTTNTEVHPGDASSKAKSNVGRVIMKPLPQVTAAKYQPDARTSTPVATISGNLSLKHPYQFAVDGVEPCFGLLVLGMGTGSGKTLDQVFKVFISQIELKSSIRLLDPTINVLITIKQQVVFQVIHLSLGQCEPEMIWGAHLFTGLW
jgi:hypothetical protein